MDGTEVEGYSRQDIRSRTDERRGSNVNGEIGERAANGAGDDHRQANFDFLFEISSIRFSSWVRVRSFALRSSSNLVS